MDSARWHALEDGFATAIALQGDERDRWLAAREAEDPILAREIRALLAAAAEPGALDRLGPRLASLPQLIEQVEGETEPAMHAELMAPARIGPYVVAREIGRGGMGVVCKAHDPRLGRDLALKIFSRTGLDAPAATGEHRVLAEARAASALDHPNICTIYDVGTLDDGRPYLAMAYYAGGTLADRLTNEPLSIRESTVIALQIADALACAHAAGIVHRDVKPRNVAFGDRGEAKLLDFGVALLRDQSDAPGSAGTPAYMSPEQIRGESVDGRTDVWALGVMLFEMLCGRRPFDGSDRRTVQHAILHDDPPDVRDLRADAPAALAEIVSHALRKTAGDRVASAADMATALRSALATQDADAKTLSVSAAPPRRRTTNAMVAVAIVGLVALVSLWSARAPQPTPAAVTSPLGTPDATVADMFARARERDGSGTAQGVEEAIRLLHSVLSRDSLYAPAHALLARAYVQSVVDGMSRQGVSAWVDTAIVHARRAIVLAPKSPDGYAALGFAYASTIRHADAVPEYLRALDLDPQHAQTMMDLARSSMALDRFDEAVTWQERALARQPGLPGARALAIARYNTWDMFDHAARHVRAGLELVPTDVQLHTQAVFLDLLEDDTASARRRYDAMLPLLSPVQQSMLGVTFEMQTGNWAAARRHVDRIVGTGATSQEFLMYGHVYRETGDRARGDSLLRLRIDALRIQDRATGYKSTQVASALAHVYSVLGHRDSALTEFARWDSLGGVASRARLGKELGWATLRTDPRWGPIIARMDARFQAGRELMRARLARELPLDSAARAREVPAR